MKKLSSKKTLVMSLLMVASVALSSCEGGRTAEGVVVDQITGETLEGVKVLETVYGMEVTTNETGKYTVSGATKGCTPECPDIVVEFSKDGYQTVTKVNDEANGTIFMEH